MEPEREQIRRNLEDAGCGPEVCREALKLYGAGDPGALIRYLRKCRCGLMEELHESQRRVDRLDYLIRQTEKAGKQV